MAAIGATRGAVPMHEEPAVSPTASPRWSGNHFIALPIVPPYTAPAPTPPRTYQKYRDWMVGAQLPDPYPPRPTRTPPMAMMTRGPTLSMSNPSTGTTHVS